VASRASNAVEGLGVLTGPSSELRLAHSLGNVGLPVEAVSVCFMHFFAVLYCYLVLLLPLSSSSSSLLLSTTCMNEFDSK